MEDNMENNKRNTIAILIIIVIFIISCVCGGSNTGQVIGNVTSKTTNQPSYKTYNIGDIIQLADHTIVLNSANIASNILKANFTLDNTGNADLAISSLLSFDAKDNEGQKLEQNIFDCGNTSFGGKVLPGDKLKGDICWTVTGNKPYKIYYSANLFSSGAIVWQIEG
jgi:hypothetical protein